MDGLVGPRGEKLFCVQQVAPPAETAALALYPKPADSFVELLVPDESASLASASTAAKSSARTTSATPTSSSVDVTVYNGQGRVQYQTDHVTAPTLRLDTSTWPSGLYQVVRRQAGKTTRQQLSIQH